jgi:hypothetical protein
MFGFLSKPNIEHQTESSVASNIKHRNKKMLQLTNIQIITQLTDLLNDIDSVVYKDALRPLHYSTTGQHVRHITEFYLCLLKGYQSGVVDYDARERNLLIEINKTFTIETLEKVVDDLQTSKADKPLVLKSSFGGDETVEISTSFFRELTYLIEHTIHHLAIIKIGLNEVYPEIQIPKNFGVAHSTIRFKGLGVRG